MRWLSEHPNVIVDKVVLVAPWLNPKKIEDTGIFFNFVLDKTLEERARITVLYSDDDEQSVLDTVTILRNAFTKANFKELHGYGHFYDDRRMEFPELLHEIVEGIK